MLALMNLGGEGTESVGVAVKVNELSRIPGTPEVTLSVPLVETPPTALLTMTVGVSDDEEETVVYPVMPYVVPR